MFKKVTLILSLISICALWRGASMLPDAAAQKAPGASRPGRTSAKGTNKQINYSKFQHSSHAGMVGGVLRLTKSQELKCDYCHQDPTPEQPKVTGYPNSKPGSKVTHSACIECHLMAARPEYPEMCLICHSTRPLEEMKKNVRVFPNPASGSKSQFYDYYSHTDHAGYFKSSKTYKELFKDKTKFKEKDNFECAACHDENPQPMTVGGLQFAKGKKEKGPGSELALLWFDREIVNTEFNPKPPQKPGQKSKPPAPFNHEAHMADYDDNPGGVFGPNKKPFSQGTQSCMICHETGKTAKIRSDFFGEFKKTMSRQPSAASCIPCHKAEMQKTIGGAVTLESAKCNFCHSLQTIKARSAKGVALPPPSHFRAPVLAETLAQNIPPPTPSVEPTQPTPDAKKPEPEQPIKPDAGPPPTPPTPTPGPAPKQKNTTTTTEAPTSPTESKPESPTPPTPTPPPAPTPTAPTPTAPTSGTRKPEPTGIVRLGDPKESDQWGQHSKWGVVENFNHGDHTKPKYSDKCEDCHHTNKDAKVEEVLKCLTCHQGPDSPVTADKGKGVSVEDAYHGVPDSEKAPKAGCIECHKRYRDKNPDSKAPIKSPCSGCHTEKAARLDPRLSSPRRADWIMTNIAALTQWMRSSRAPAMALTR